MHLRRQRALILAVAALLVAVAAHGGGEAMPGARLVWSMDDPAFGGWSGLEVSDDGTRFTAISDRGRLVSGTLGRDGSGALVSVAAGPLRVLGDTREGAFGRQNHDSEGLAVAPDGRVFVSFERIQRVLAYPDAGVATAAALPGDPRFDALRRNTGLEALAIGPDGALYTVPEGADAPGRPFPVYRFDGTGWQVVGHVSDPGDGFVPVGADIGPDGRFYLIERKFAGIFGFATRVRRYDVTADGLANETDLLRTHAGTYDNLEGLAVWRDADGHIRLTMISDDNFNVFQKTELVEFVLPE